ncbi:MAG: SMC-Scp complex subunit ScpB [Natronohydrobacter sp.]|nr:SMC-Scp complex subunit ScpB [Natronohydrobacter sp.]
MTAGFDRDLSDMPPDLRWRVWMQRIEAVLFASAQPVARTDLARIVGQGASVDLLLADLAADLTDRPYELVRHGTAWALRTRPAFGPVIRAAADVQDQALNLGERDLTVLVAIALPQPGTRDFVRVLGGRGVCRAALGRVAEGGLCAPGPRAPRRGAPHSFITTDAFLVAFNLASLADLTELDIAQDAGLLPMPKAQR